MSIRITLVVIWLKDVCGLKFSYLIYNDDLEEAVTKSMKIDFVTAFLFCRTCFKNDFQDL